LFDPCVCGRGISSHYFFEDFLVEPFEEIVGQFSASLSIAGIAGKSFESRDVFVDVWVAHKALFEVDARPFFSRGVLELSSEFDEKGIPYFRYVICNWVHAINPSS
jgi:hypothetical protein